MGNDGGSIPKRRELVKEAARNPTTSELKETKKEQLAHRWSTCPISHKPLIKPVVSDYEGILYNKDAILQYLLPAEVSTIDKEECEKVIQGRIKGLKDVVEVIFQEEKDDKTKAIKWVCPVTSKELGPAVKAVYLVPCGHAFSLEAITETKGDQCLQCSQSYESRDVISILPTDDERVVAQARMEKLSSLGLSHSIKKAPGKKRKANGAVKVEGELQSKAEFGSREPPPAPLTVNGTKADDIISRPSTPVSRTATPKISGGIKNAAIVGLTVKVLEEEEAKKKRRLQQGENENLKSLFTKSNSDRRHKDADFMTRGYSISANARHQ